MSDGQGERDARMEGRRLAHDLLQSVAILQALVGSLRTSGAVEGEAGDSLDRIHRELQVVAAVCQRQLEGPVTEATVDLAEVAARVVDRARVLFDGDVGLEAAPTTILGDALEWERCLFNLVENACRAASPGGRVLVLVRDDDEEATVMVSDSGPGFGKAMSGRASLGMSIVLALVHDHDGSLDVRTGRLGGAEVTVVVPRR